MDYTSTDLLDKIIQGQHTGAKEVFTSIMNDKIISELGTKKVELAQDLLPSMNDETRIQSAIDKAKDIKQQQD